MDKLLLLSEGRTAYFGPADKAVATFSSWGISCHAQFNPADFFLDVLTSQELSTLAVKSWSSFAEQTLENSANKPPPTSRALSLSNTVIDVDTAVSADIELIQQDAQGDAYYPTVWSEQVVILTQRAFKQSRGEVWTVVNFMQSFFIATVVAIIWFQTPEHEVFY